MYEHFLKRRLFHQQKVRGLQQTEQSAVWLLFLKCDLSCKTKQEFMKLAFQSVPHWVSFFRSNIHLFGIHDYGILMSNVLVPESCYPYSNDIAGVHRWPSKILWLIKANHIFFVLTERKRYQFSDSENYTVISFFWCILQQVRFTQRGYSQHNLDFMITFLLAECALWII